MLLLLLPTQAQEEKEVQEEQEEEEEEKLEDEEEEDKEEKEMLEQIEEDLLHRRGGGNKIRKNGPRSEGNREKLLVGRVQLIWTISAMLDSQDPVISILLTWILVRVRKRLRLF